MTDQTEAELVALTRDLSSVYQTDIAPDALVVRFLRGAYTDLLTRAQWPFLTHMLQLEVPAGASRVPVPVGSRVRSVQALVRNRLVELVPATPVHLAQAARVPGPEPVWFYENRTDSVLEVVPSAAPVTLFVLVLLLPAPELMPAGIPPRYQDALAYRAAAKLLAREGEDGDRQNWLASEYEGMAAAMATELLDSVSDAMLSFNADATRLGRWEL